MANYPGSIVAITDPTSNNNLSDNAVLHNSQHSTVNDEVVAIETVLGTNPATITPVAASASPTSVANYLDMVGQRFIDITGMTHWYDSFTGYAVTKGGTGVTTFTAGLVYSSGGTAALTTVAAPVGAVVGTSDSQTLTNKVIDGSQLVDSTVTSRKAKLTNSQVGANNSLNLTNALQDVPGATATFSVSVTSVLLAWGAFDIDFTQGTAPGNQDDVVTGGLTIDGSEQSPLAILQCDTAAHTRGVVSQSWVVALSSGSHTIKLQALNNQGSRGRIGVTHTTLSYLIVSQ